MQPLRAPRTLSRRAAVQQSDVVPSSAVLRRGAAGRLPAGQFLSRYNDWQVYARQYARTISAAAFAPAVIADLVARCDVRVEQRVGPDEWEPYDNAAFAGLFELYRNALQGPDELVRMHVHHYEVAGEMIQTQLDAQRGGVDYGIYSTGVVEWDQPEPGLVTVKLTPDGKVQNDTAFVVPRAQAVRFWIPDHEYQAYATSPMASSIDDLHRYNTLRRATQATADSQLANAGVLWAPSQANESLSTPDDNVLDEDDPAAPATSLEDAYYDLAKLRIDPWSEDVAGIAPAFWTWDKELGAPVWIDVGRNLDAQGIAHRKEALEDFARSGPLPASTLVGGGVGDANHWSEWLATEKVFASGVAPIADRVFHLDLTWSFLWPRARLTGMGEEELANLRLGYDPTPVIVHPDRSASARELLRSGVISFDATLEATGFTEDDALVDQDQKDWLLAVLSNGAAGDAGGAPPPAAAPGTTTEAPPQPESSSPGAVTPPTLVAASMGNGHANGARLADFDESKVVREAGRFAPKDAEADEKSPEELNADRVENPGAYYNGDGTPEDPYEVDNADIALELIERGANVEMDPEVVSIAIEKLAAIGNEARALGVKAPVYDLCKISSGGTNLFCGETVRGTRLEMPQLLGKPTPGSAADALPKNSDGEADIVPGMLARLESEGVHNTHETVGADVLKASQNELNGAKVASMMTGIEAGKVPPGSVLVSRDNYIIDGHHRWAANASMEYVKGTTPQVDVVRIDMPIQQVLSYADAYSAEQGIPPAQASLRAPAPQRVAQVLGRALLAMAE